MSPAELKAVEALALLKAGDKLEHGRTYYGKIQLSGLESMFGSATDVSGKLTAAGFAGVLVSSQPIDDVPDRAPFPSGSTFWARGIWSGADKQLGGGAVPSQIKAIWRSEAAVVDPATVKSKTPVVTAAAGPSLKQLLFFGGAIYLLRRGRGRRMLRGLGLRL